MKIGMSIGLYQAPELAQRLEQQLRLGMTMDQRLSILMTVRMELLQIISDERYDPYGSCPGCLKQLTLQEILKGFRQDPTDITTECPKCKHRFVAMLRNVSRTGASKVDIPFYCPSQTIAALSPLSSFAPERIEKEHQAVFQSAVVHFGSVYAAFRKGSIAYPFKQKEKEAWREKVSPFFGRMPDAEIARIVGCSPTKVGRARKALHIEPFRWRDHVDEHH